MKALDLFAGTGWGVACQRLGIEEMGVEIMPEAIATREANGMETIYGDVWEGLFDSDLRVIYDLLIASPPCQTFSLAGKGSGRKALDDVLEAIDTYAFMHPPRLRQFGRDHDERTALVLTPLAHVFRDMPMYATFEQVPTVLPVWEACAKMMEAWGYSVKTGLLNAEQYGVPQTRKRAILVARRDGIEAQLPTPTHSRYYSTNPSKLDDGVLPWVSMAEALGWGGFTAEKRMGRGMVERYGDRPGRTSDEPAFSLRASAGGTEPGGFVLRSNYGTGGDASKRGERRADHPAPTLTSKADRNKWDGTRKMVASEAAALQSYPSTFRWHGAKTKQFLQIGNAVPPLLAQPVLESLTEGASSRKGAFFMKEDAA